MPVTTLKIIDKRAHQQPNQSRYICSHPMGDLVKLLLFVGIETDRQ